MTLYRHRCLTKQDKAIRYRQKEADRKRHYIEVNGEFFEVIRPKAKSAAERRC
jgi:hypothetical protein